MPRQTKAQIGNSRPKKPTRSLSQASIIDASGQRISASTGHSSVLCGCGCGESFIPRIGGTPQKYLRGHRFSAYKLHACPDCGVSHRIGVSKGVV